MEEDNETKAERLRRATGAILIFPLAVWLVWDVFVATNEVKDDTISEITRDLSHYLYVVPYALGGIMGHFFLNKKDLGEGRPNRFKTWLGTVLFVFVLSFFLPNLHYMNTAMLIAGFVIGAFLWPQGPRSK